MAKVPESQLGAFASNYMAEKEYDSVTNPITDAEI